MPNNILIISPTPTHPGNVGSQARVYSLAKRLIDEGNNVSFLYISKEVGDQRVMREFWGDNYYFHQYKPPKYNKALHKKIERLITGERKSIDLWYDESIDNTIDKITTSRTFDVVMVEYVFFSRALEKFPAGVLKIIDTIDVFSDRHDRMKKQGLAPTWYSTIKRQESKGLNRADIIIAITEEDGKCFTKLTPKKIVTIGHEVVLHKCPPSDPQSNIILFVGSSNPMNVQAAKYFSDKIMHLVKTIKPSAEFHVAGSVCSLLSDGAYRKHGVVDDLFSIYYSASVVVNPMLFGTGLSIKSLDALAHARPLVTTDVGARGLMSGAGWAFLVADQPDVFAEQICRLLGDKEYAASLGDSAYTFAEDWNRRNVGSLLEAVNSMPGK